MDVFWKTFLEFYPYVLLPVLMIFFTIRFFTAMIAYEIGIEAVTRCSNYLVSIGLWKDGISADVVLYQPHEIFMNFLSFGKYAAIKPEYRSLLKFYVDNK